MSTNLALRLQFETVRSLAFGSIGGAYMGIGTALTRPARQVFVQNLTDASLMFSINGVNDHFALPAQGFLLLDITANHAKADGFYIALGTRFYVRTIGTPTSGTVYVSSMYGVTT